MKETEHDLSGRKCGYAKVRSAEIVDRLFRTNVDQHIKRNLIIFVTARLVNPAGQPLNRTEEEEEQQDVIQPTVLPETPMYKK